MPNCASAQPGFGTAQPAANNPAPQRKMDRIDPKQMPRRLVEKGNDTVSLFFTRSGQNPPPSNSEFKVQSQGIFILLKLLTTGH